MKIEIQGQKVPFNKKLSFKHFDNAAIAFLYKLVISDGWSLTYSMRHFKSGIKGFYKFCDSGELGSDRAREIRDFSKKRTFEKQGRYIGGMSPN